MQYVGENWHVGRNVARALKYINVRVDSYPLIDYIVVKPT
jgi:hypothetical protein